MLKGTQYVNTRCYLWWWWVCW